MSTHPRTNGAETHTKRWVAIVDDDESVRRALARILRTEGISVSVFGCAQEYLRVSSTQGDPACLVLDVHLGASTMSGFDLQTFLSENGTEVPIILMTAHDDVPSADLARRVGGNNYLRKPFKREALVSMIQRAFDSRNGNSDLCE